MKTQSLLNEDLEAIGLTGDFCQSSRQMGFRTIAGILACPIGEILDKPGFSYSWLAELSDFLSSKGLLKLLQPIPGRSYG